MDKLRLGRGVDRDSESEEGQRDNVQEFAHIIDLTASIAVSHGGPLGWAVSYIKPHSVHG